MKRKQKIAAVAAGVLAAYVLSYVLDSAAGGYWPIPDSARISENTFGESEDVLWQPRFGYSSARYASPLGIFYAPLIRLDRLWRHKTHGMEDDGAGMYYESARPLADFHPATREYVRLARALYGRHAKRSRQELEADPDFVGLRSESERLLEKSGWDSR